MKKLIAMIGAVAMSFGLFAASPAPFTISFETAESEKGISNDGVFNPNAEGVTGWTWTGDPFALSQYADEVLPYESGAKARRDGMFDAETGNSYYLPLSTGNDKLTRAVGTDNLYLDQLVKFTGFEDPQTNLVAGTKIAIWMSEFENDDESTETNLYVTVGKVDIAGNAEQIALKVAGTYSLNTWYRLTVKSLGNIMADGSSRAGFLIYVNGEKVASSDEAAATLIAEDALTDTAKKYMQKKQLFTSIAADATFTSVGYQGIGAIDDIIVDAEGPDFCVETVNVSFTTIGGAIIAAVVDSEGTVVQNPDGTYTVKPGALTVTLAAAEGHKLFGTLTYNTSTDVAVDGVINIAATETTAAEVVATLTVGEADPVDLAEKELAGALASLGEGDVIATVADCSVMSDDVEPVALYTFTPNTSITKTADGWEVVVMNYEMEATETPGVLMVADDIAADFTMNVMFADPEGTLGFSGAAVNGQLIVATGMTMTMADVSVGANGLIKADSLTVGSTITLSEVGATVKALDNTLIGSGSIVAGADLEPQVSPEPDKDGYYTYTAVQAGVEKVELAFTSLPADTAVTAVTGNTVEGDAETGWKAVAGDTLTITLTAQNGKVFNENGDTTTTVQAEASASIDLSAAPAPFAAVAQVNDMYYETAEAALAKVQELKAAEQFPIVAKALADAGLTIANPKDGSTITIAKNDTITIGANSLTFSGLPAITGQIALAADATFTVVGQIANYTTVFSAPADYEVVETANGEGKYTYSASAIPTYTVADITVANAKVEATNKTAGATLALPDTVLRDTEIAVTVTPNKNYEYKTTPAGWTKNEDGSITTNATVTADLAITVEAPTEAITPVDPGEPIPSKTPDEVNANLDKYLKVPEIQGIDAAIYRAMFAAKQAGDAVVIDLKPAVEEAIQVELNAATATVIAPDETGKATITARIGLYYGIKAAGEVGSVDTEAVQNGVQATTTTLKITVPTADSKATPFTDKAFFKTICSPKAFK